MKDRPPINARTIYRSDDPMDQFNCDYLAALDDRLHRRLRVRRSFLVTGYGSVADVIELICEEVSR